MVGTPCLTDRTVPENRAPFFNRELALFAGVTVLLFVVLRLFFPVPDYNGDSCGYLLGAINGDGIGYRPMGLSAFYAWLHRLNPTYQAVAWTQLVLHLVSTVFFLYVVHVTAPLRPVYRRLLWGVALWNLALLHLANFLLADSVFTSLTIAWAACTLLLLVRPSWVWLAGALLCLWLALFVRYNALVYPLVAIAAVLLFCRHRLLKWARVAGFAVVALVFYDTIVGRMDAATDEAVFSGFSGWQLASNAVTAYRYQLPAHPLETADPELRALDAAARTYTDTTIQHRPEYRASLEPDFMWRREAPFRQLEYRYHLQNPYKNAFAVWVLTSLTLERYGKAVIRQHPGAFLAHYLLPNFRAYLYPDLEVLASRQAITVPYRPILVEWYNLPVVPSKAHAELPRWYDTPSLGAYSLFTLAFLVLVPWAMWTGRLWGNRRALLGFLALFWLLKTGFDVFAAPVVLRYVLLLTPLAAAGALVALQQLQERRALKAAAITGSDAGISG